jgi:hypothetical protein
MATDTVTEDEEGPAVRPVEQGMQHEEMPGGEWKCAACGNVNRAHQKVKCHMKKCGAPRHGSVEMWQLATLSFNARGAKRDADGIIVAASGGSGSGGGGGGRVYSMMSREQAEEAAAAAAGATAGAGAGGSNKQPKKEKDTRPSLYAAQKPLTGKQKNQKGSSNPGAWR